MTTQAARRQRRLKSRRLTPYAQPRNYANVGPVRHPWAPALDADGTPVRRAIPVPNAAANRVANAERKAAARAARGPSRRQRRLDAHRQAAAEHR